MGANGETVKSISELEAAFKRAKESDKTYVISMKTDGYEWLEGTAFWESPTLELYNTEGKKSALNEFLEGKNKQRKGCLLYTSPSPRDATLSRMPSCA